MKFMNEFKYTSHIDSFGTFFCYNKEGYLDNESAPAIIYINGWKGWYKNGKLHRLDGPAIEQPDGSKLFYIWDIKYSETDYWKEIDILNKLKGLL